MSAAACGMRGLPGRQEAEAGENEKNGTCGDIGALYLAHPSNDLLVPHAALPRKFCHGLEVGLAHIKLSLVLEFVLGSLEDACSNGLNLRPSQEIL